MHVDTRLRRGDRVRTAPTEGWPHPGPIWELVCDPRFADDDPRLNPRLRSTGQWFLHVRYVTAGTCDNSAVGDEDQMMASMNELEFISRATNPGKPCEWECR
jgi:hypothetical protein